ncbi:MAG: ABC transporter ATP-binding protein [Bauldia sp.]|nr:ABC transporter ATP-binding protein [Bauldia sp.]
MNAVEIAGLSKRYGRTLALDDINLTIGADETFALLGPNGAGKTTLIHILCTILRPDSGTAKISGHDVVRQSLRARKNLGVIFQEPSLDARLTVRENLEFHGMVYRVPRAVRRQRITELLELVDLSDWADKLVRTLSAGMKRRVELARALIHDAKVVILDEPTVGLDAQSRSNIWTYLRQLKAARGFTLIVTTHYIEEVDEADRVCIIDHGRILALDAPSTLRAEHGREIVRVVPRDAAATAAIRARFPTAEERDGDIAIIGADSTVTETLLRDFGPQIRNLSYDRPSLESVFLALTGREIRDQPATRGMRG